MALSFVSKKRETLPLVPLRDMVVFPHLDLWLWRQLAAGAAVGVMLYGFIWEREP